MATVCARALNLLDQGVGTAFSGYSLGVISGTGRCLHVGGHTTRDGGEPVTETTQFDIASLTKVMVGRVAARYVAAGEIDPDAPIGPLLPELPREEGSLSVRELGTHCSGLGSSEFFPELSGLDHRERWRGFFRRVRIGDSRGAFRYSCLNYILLGLVLERVTGTGLDAIVREELWAPLKMTNTSFGALDPPAAVATEVDAVLGRGPVQGQVHDELAWLLADPVGNAGVFASGADLLLLLEDLVEVGRQSGPAATELFTDHAPAAAAMPFGHSFGLRINDPEFMGTWGGYGHTGFTGCAIYIAEDFSTAYVVTTNSVHPHRGQTDTHLLRRQLTDALRAG